MLPGPCQLQPFPAAAAWHCESSTITYEPSGHTLLWAAPHAKSPAHAQSRHSAANFHTHAATANKQKCTLAHGAATNEGGKKLGRAPNEPQTNQRSSVTKQTPLQKQSTTNKKVRKPARAQMREGAHPPSRLPPWCLRS
jgi:hypothetical protein